MDILELILIDLGFKQMLADIENEKINTIITKDLSRLGRDYIDTGYYIEKYFPMRKIRYIAVNDGVDTIDEQNSNNEITPFKAVINDLYAKDISKKVKTALLTKAMNGESIKPFAPYGYKKDGKNRIVIDEIVEENVKKLYQMYLSGSSKKEICNYLNTNNIITPLMYKMQYTNYKNPNNVSKEWCISTITNILKDRMYIGDLVQHKYSSINYKIKKVVKLEQSKNIIIKNNHKAIIKREDFEKVSQMLKGKSNECKRESKSSHILTGIVFCQKCGARIAYTKNHGSSFKIICSNYKKNGKKACDNIYIEEQEILNCIKQKIIENVKKRRLEHIIIGRQNKCKEEIEKLNLQKIKNINAIKQIYTDIANNEIEKLLGKQIIAKYVKENENIEIKIEQYQSKIKERKVNVIKQIEEADGEKLRRLIFMVIKRVELSKSNMKIQYNFENYF